VDADGENESLLRWSDAGEWTIPVIGLPVNDLHRRLPGIAGDRYSAVVFDTPPMKERLGVVASALRLATHVLVPMAPTGIEYSRLPAIREILDDTQRCDPRRHLSSPWCSPARFPMRPPPRSTDNLFATMGSGSYAPTVGRLERYAHAYGLPISNAAATAYGDIVAELLTPTEVLMS
jgi:chromosome partitioning protein